MSNDCKDTLQTQNKTVQVQRRYRSKSNTQTDLVTVSISSLNPCPVSTICGSKIII